MTNTTSTPFRRYAGALAVSAVALVACGGSDDDGLSDAAAAPAGSDADDAPPTGESNATESDASGSDVSDEAGDDVAESGSNDEAQQSFDEAGVDLDLDELEDTVTGFSTGDGGGAVTIDGAEYSFVAEICVAQGPSFLAEGPSEGPDGVPAWVTVSYASDYDIDGDGENDETLEVYVEVGKSELFGSGADDQPDWAASKIDSSALQTGADISVSFEGASVSGSGTIDDYNGVAIPFGETAPMTFEASCS